MATLSTLMRLVGRQRITLLSCCILIMFVSALTLVVPLYTQFVIEYIVPAEDVRLIQYAAVSFVVFLVVRFGLTVLQDLSVAIFRQKAERDYNEAYIAATFNLQLDEFNTYRIGEIINRFGVFFNDIEWFICDFVFFVFYALFIFVFCSILMVSLNPLIFAVVLAFIPLHVLNFWVHARKLRQASESYLSDQARLSAFVLQSVDARDEIKSYFLNDLFAQRMAGLADQMHAALGARQGSGYRQEAFQSSLVVANHIAVMMAGCFQVINGTSSLGTLFFFLLLLQFFYSPIYRFSAVSQALQAACVKIDEMYKIIANPRQERLESRAPASGPVERLRLEELSFGNLIKGASWQFEAGRIYFLAGESGAGKTTLFSLLARFRQPDGGTIFFDRQDAAQLSEFDLRTYIGYAIQERLLFNSSIVENIHLAPEQPVDMQRVAEACYYAVADEFIEQLPRTYWSEVQENGANLSGGQQQRLALARVFYHDAPILLLDEPTSALDTLTERLFYERLQQLKQRKIIIIVSHRPETYAYGDAVLRLHQGKLTPVYAAERVT